MNTTIHLPMHTKTVRKGPSDPYFDVNIQKYLREDGVDDGLRAIVHGETKKTLGEVKKGYKLVTHKEASNIVCDFLNTAGLEFNSEGGVTGVAGARYFERISFPKYAFTPQGTSTAIDIRSMGAHEGFKSETMVPYIVVKNSYDKTAALSFDYGVSRLLCSNGMAIIAHEDRILSYRHNQKIDIEGIRGLLMDRLQENINLIETAYARLNSDGGQQYLKGLIEGDYPDKFKLDVLAKINPYAKVESETIVDADGKHKTLKITSIDTPESAWAVYNIATDVASHTLTSRIDQEKVGRKIAKEFQIG